MNKFFRDASIMTMANGASAILGALALLIAVRHLSVTDWSVVALIVSLGPLMSLLISMGTVTYGVRRLSGYEERFKRHSEFCEFIGRRASLSVVLFVLALIVWTMGHRVASAVIGLAAFRFFRGGTTVLLSSERRFGSQSVVLVGEKVVTLTATFLLLDLGVGVFALPLAQACGALVAGSVSLLLSSLKGDWIAVANGLRSPHKMWRGSGYFGVTSLASSLQQADVAIVTLAANSYQAGLFAAAARIPSTLNVLGGALAQVVIPTASRAGFDFGSVTKRARRFSMALGVIVLVAISLLVSTAGAWVPFLLGNEYHAAVDVVRVYLVSVLLAVLNQPIIALLQARGEDKWAARIVACNVLCALALQALGASLHGALGASVGFFVATVGATCVLLYRACRLFSSR